MEVIVPQIITDSSYTPVNETVGKLLDSSITDAVTTPWAAGTTYASGEKVYIVEPSTSTQRGIRVAYESLQSSNTGNNPYTSPTYWVSLGATETYKMFDLFTNTKTTDSSNDIVVYLHCQKINSIGFLNTQASSIDIEVYAGTAISDTEIEYDDDGSYLSFNKGVGVNASTITCSTGDFIADGFKNGSKVAVSGSTSNDGIYTIFLISATSMILKEQLTATENGVTGTTTLTVAPLLDENLNLSNELTSYHEYFFDDFEYIRDVTSDVILPALNNVVVKLTFNKYSAQDCYAGHVVVGRKYDIGETRWGASTGIESYGRKIEDPDFGYTYYKQGNFKKKLDVDLLIPTDRFNEINNILTQLREVPTLWQANQNGTNYDNLLVYGVCGDFEIVHEGTNNIEAEYVKLQYVPSSALG